MSLRIPEQDMTVDDIIARTMRKPTGYKIIAPLYTKESEEVSQTGGLVKKPTWKLFIAKTDYEGDADLILDLNCSLNPRLTDIVVTNETESTVINRFCADLTPKARSKVESVLFERINRPQGYNSEMLPNLLLSSGVLKRPIPRISDINSLASIDWTEFVDSLVEYECKKDERIKLFLKQTLLRGIVPQLNPHGIIAKKPGSGVTTFYQIACMHIGKATKVSTVGFAKSRTEIEPGVFNEQDITIAIDQIESQEEEDIFGYLYDISETGETSVTGGSVRFPVHSTSTIVFIANIIPADIPEKSFRYLVDKIAFNCPAFFKRIGLILFNENTEPVKDKTTEDVTFWKRRVQYFRAVEDMAFPTLRNIYHNNVVWKWSQLPLGEYRKEVKEIISSIRDVKLRYSLREHADGAEPRVRGSGLNVVLAEMLKEFALKHSYELRTDILNPAEEYAYQSAEENKASLTRIANTWDIQKENLKESVYKNILPNYLKEIASAVEHFRQAITMNKQQIPEEVPIQILGNDYQSIHFQYFTYATNLLKQAKKAIERYNHYLREYYGFELVRKELGDIHVKFLE